MVCSAGAGVLCVAEMEGEAVFGVTALAKCVLKRSEFLLCFREECMLLSMRSVAVWCRCRRCSRLWRRRQRRVVLAVVSLRRRSVLLPCLVLQHLRGEGACGVLLPDPRTHLPYPLDLRGTVFWGVNERHVCVFRFVVVGGL